MKRSVALLFVALEACSRANTAPVPTSSFETVISGGRIVDGTGNPWFYGDIGISGDRIVRIAPAGMLRQAPARRRIDARSLVVAPGVIDIQAHSEEPLLTGDSRVVSMITQGVTTMIMGEGDTPGQFSQTMLNDYMRSGDTAVATVLQGFVGPRGFGAWLDFMGRRTAAVNVGS